MATQSIRVVAPALSDLGNVAGCRDAMTRISTADISDEHGETVAVATPLLESFGGAERGVPLTFAGVTFEPGHVLYADEDGIVLSPIALPL